MSFHDENFPPRKRNWTKGRAQVGLFIRTEDGAIITIVRDNTDPDFALQMQHVFLADENKEKKP